MVAHRIVHTIREFATDDLIVKVSVLRRFLPLTRLRVADGVLAVLWLFAALPEIRVIEPCELNPFAIEADCIIKIVRDVGIAFISWEPFKRAFLKAIFRLRWPVSISANLKMHCLYGSSG